MKATLRAYGSPLGRGVVRAQPEDFIVTERYDFEPTGKGEHLLLWIEKRSANTGWVANQLASHFGLRHFDVSYCGKKDRHAVTRQWFSCYLPSGGIPELSDFGIEGVSVLGVTRHARKLRRGTHTGNDFVLTIRELEVTDRAALEARLSLIQQQGFPNYFGRQRFGRDGQNVEKACELVSNGALNSRRKLNRKQKDIYVSALRSWLFNETLAKEVEADSWCDDGILWVYGRSPHRDIMIPRPAPEHQQAAEFIDAIAINAHGRAKRVIPTSLTWNWQKDALELSFGLPVGAYATTLLEELLEFEEADKWMTLGA